jgi:uncharacterized protein (TIGR00255 family)
MALVRSMTGFGIARREAEGDVAQVEARTVNNRHLAMTIRVPGAFESRLPELEALARTRLQRGTLNATINVRVRRDVAPGRINGPVVEDYARQLAAAGLPTTAEVIGQILRLPGAVEEAPPQPLGDAEFALAREAFDAALVGLVAMREREGAALSSELESGAIEVERLAGLVAARAPAAVRAAEARMKERLATLLGDATLPQEIIAREIAVLADRTDVAEEVARLASHVAQWRDALREGGPIGRRLDFLAQELGRESNTIGSKSQDADIARVVVDMKVAIERLKEQAANVE